jgi:coproporphyrinogen III oxidase
MIKTDKSKKACKLVEYIQFYFVKELNSICDQYGNKKHCEEKTWTKKNPIYGGGQRFEGTDETIFNRASVNVSSVHYDEDSGKQILLADAISAIIHPLSPFAPSIHMHFSYTQKKNKIGYFRLMSDLNPSINNDDFKNDFTKMLKSSTGSNYGLGSSSGNKYFYIPQLNRTRGVKHFYLDNYNGESFDSDLSYIKKVAIASIDCYISIFKKALEQNKPITQKEKQQQIDYHTLYFFQVLTLDRGTIAGLLIHNQNDIGIMGSIPSHINKTLLKSWVDTMPPPQDELLNNLIGCLEDKEIALIDVATKKKLANILREHYIKYPEAIRLQASGYDVII